jgi:hypothetical protein
MVTDPPPSPPQLPVETPQQPSEQAAPPAFAGSVFDAQESGQSPLVALLESLYSKDPRTIARYDGAVEAPDQITLPSLPVFTYAHECRLLREPFENGAGGVTRPCIMGDSCMGMHKNMSGHRESGGVVLSEMMTPEELQAFEESGALPADRRMCLLCVRYNVTCAYLFARKQRLFSSAHVFNSYVNVVGSPGEYRADCTIPMAADNGAWLGIIGGTAALRLDALRLVQDERNRWYVDQSGMQQGFQKGLAQNQSAVRSERFDAREWLAHFFKHRSDVSDRDILFDDVEDLKNRHAKIPSPTHERFMAWRADAVKSFSHRLLYYRVNRLNEMLYACGQYYGRDWLYAMHVFVDAHIPMVALFESGQRVTSFVLKYTAHEETLPDACAEITNAVMGGSASSISSLTAVMLRVLPELAQPTQFNALLSKHASAVTSFTHAVSLCAMLGNYRSNVPPPFSFEVRKSIIVGFTPKACAAAMKSLQPDQMFFFYAYREYIGFVLQSLPCVEALLEAQVAFAKQRARVSDALRSARNANPTEFGEFISTLNDHYRRNYKRLPKRKQIPRGRGDRSNALCIVTTRTAKKRNLKRTAGNAFDIELFNTVAKRIKTDGIAAAVNTVADERVHAVAEAARYDAFAEGATKLAAGYHVNADEETIKVLSDIAHAADAVCGVVRVPLPPAFARAQLDAVARRFGVPVDDPVVSRITRLFFCLGCGGCKNFVASRVERTGKMVAVRAAGYKKVSLNYMVPDAPMVCIETPDCSRFSVEGYDIVTRGGAKGADDVESCVLVTRKMAVLVSPCCGQLIHANALAANLNSAHGYDCPACAASLRKEFCAKEPDARVCAYCSKRIPPKHANNTILLFDEEGALYKFGFCKSHFRPWARTQDGYCTLGFVSKHMQNRRGSGLVLPS